MEDKIVRICWNTEGWKKPSGIQGKSKNKDAYEDIVGYGHEEWLFDINKIINGYHYGFLQPANNGKNAHKGKIVNVHLYTINSETGTRWWVGEIDNVELVHDEESEIVYNEYKKLGWFYEMVQDLKDVGATFEDLEVFDPKNFVNVKFKPNDIQLESPPKQFSAKDGAIKATYYNFQKFDGNPNFIKSIFNFVPGHNPGKDLGWKVHSDHKTKIDYIHNKIQNGAYLQLAEQFGNSNVGTEQINDNGTRVDLVVKTSNTDYTFYEIKTSASLLGCIREALSQLLEYAYFPSNENAKKLIIISPNKINKDAIEYLGYLREKFNLPIYYQCFDLELAKLESDVH